METNNRDKNIKEKFANRTFEPSASAWERLSAQLDEQPTQKKKGWFFYMGAAASILLLVSIGTQLFSDNSIVGKPTKEIIINNPLDTNIIDKKSIKFINEITAEKLLVNADKVAEEQLEINGIANKVEKIHPKKKNKIAKVDSQIVTAKADENFLEKKLSEINKGYLEQDPNSIIKINSTDLLYAVTHTSEEVKSYYAKNNLQREDILKTIISELKKSNIKINPETILAEVERTIDDDDFQNNFMKSLKNKISDIATVIASRNN
jgi:hypothetical protein